MAEHDLLIHVHCSSLYRTVLFFLTHWLASGWLLLLIMSIVDCMSHLSYSLNHLNTRLKTVSPPDKWCSSWWHSDVHRPKPVYLLVSLTGL